MPENNNDDLRTMQEEAVRRVREMQRRSQSYIGEQPSDPPPPSQPSDTASPSLSAPLLDIAGIKLDEEKALIGLLIYVLYKNNADIKLLLALGYLLL